MTQPLRIREKLAELALRGETQPEEVMEALFGLKPSPGQRILITLDGPCASGKTMTLRIIIDIADINKTAEVQSKLDAFTEAYKSYTGEPQNYCFTLYGPTDTETPSHVPYLAKKPTLLNLRQATSTQNLAEAMRTERRQCDTICSSCCCHRYYTLVM